MRLFSMISRVPTTTASERVAWQAVCTQSRQRNHTSGQLEDAMAATKKDLPASKDVKGGKKAKK